MTPDRSPGPAPGRGAGASGPRRAAGPGNGRSRLLVAIIASLVAAAVLVPSSHAAAEPLPVMGTQAASAARLVAWFETQDVTPDLPLPVAELAALFVEEGAAEGIRGDVAFAQSVLETAYFTFPSTGQVHAGDHNYGGLGAVDGGSRGNRFDSPREGVRAQVQHLRAYADEGVTPADLAAPLVDPRFDYVDTGRAPHWEDLGGGVWASDPGYGRKVVELWGRIAAVEEPAGAPPPPAPGTVAPPLPPAGGDATEQPGAEEESPPAAGPRSSEVPAPDGTPEPDEPDAPAPAPDERGPGAPVDPVDEEAGSRDGGGTGAAAERVAGEDRFATAAAAARRGWPDGAGTVHLVSGASWADALAAGPAAAADGAPLLLARPDGLPEVTRDALTALSPAEVVVHGGPAVIAPAVPDEVAAALSGAAVTRLAGPDRAGTAATVATSGWPDGAATVVVASGADWVDALAAAPAAAAADAPLLLAGRDELPAATSAALSALGTRRAVVAGGPAAVGETAIAELEATGLTVNRAAGPDRWSTAAALADLVDLETGGELFAAAGHTWPDALAAGPAAVRASSPLLLVGPDEVPVATAAAVATVDPARAVVLGGEAVVSDAVLAELGAAAAR